MEAMMLHSSPDQSLSPYKQHIRTPRKSNRPFISQPSENFVPSHFHGGLLHAPPPFSLSYSYPPSITLLRPQQQEQYQPPLLPFPVSKPCNNNSRSRGLSCSPVNRKTSNRTRHQSLTPKKSQPSITSPKKEGSKQEAFKPAATVTKLSSDGLIMASTNRLGPDPKDLPRVVSRVLISSSLSGTSDNINNGASSLTSMEDQVAKFSGSVAFTLSPPPSSLPLPTFSLRPKLSCNAEAAGIDAGATDNLRRILRLR